MGSLVAELAEKLSSATNNFDIDEGTIYVNTSADTVGIGTTSPGSKFDVQGTMQVGVNDTGHDVKFFGATAGAYLEWDESADEFAFATTSGEDGTTSGNVTIDSYANIHADVATLTATTARYADLAEMYAGDEDYEVGTVVVVGGTNEVTACSKHADSSLAGVVSENPGYLMNRDIEAEFPVCVGFVGRVPVKVVGHIEKGDLLTTSSIKGCATKYSKGTQQVGTIIGVALEDKTEDGESTIEVMLKRC